MSEFEISLSWEKRQNNYRPTLKMDFQKQGEDLVIKRCAATGCSVSSTTTPHVKLFNFPSHLEVKRYNKWLKFSNNPALSGCVKDELLCSRHFARSQFKNPDRDTLRSKAIPTIRRKLRKHVNVKKSVPLKMKKVNKPAGQVSKEQNKLVAYNSNCYITFNQDLNIRPIQSNENVSSNSSLEEDITNLAIDTISKFFGKPPDITSEDSFDKWINFAKTQNIICDQVEYALSTAKRLGDFMRSHSPDSSNEPFFGFPDDENSDFVLMDTEAAKLL